MNICNLEYDDELNKRLNTRHFPSQSLPPLFEVRPVSTKYTFFQTIEERPTQKINPLQYKMYSPESTFNPGSRAPTDYFLNNIDTESTLRNQFMALQKSNQSVYLPELSSSLYKNDYEYRTTQSFTPTDCKTNTINKDLAPNKFNNFTRYNLRN
jgi:hypothetical protein